ncbi:NAD(P)(+) transhydrogenase (Re/Si-specific) subunit alpha [Enemella dayhoffiae]|uniref:NAD(P) transhydrogenase subunit alpha n=1 Tax=Enemella dayhoffiae TaxID=2016507 RepID=A0A255GTM8_9ACTN|nr:Re/Si-specific NAD(P)(+) transhydrogenase subunit alpha [Enemella dayhoffiae]OYO18066.1 NAD(P)(+) transhydrogenase (Re/Si-specific) subunit alpha [Enemella dayhoffiae]
MRIGVPKELRPGETMVAATPKTVTQLVGLGFEVVVESGAGALAHLPDPAYAAAGAFVGDAAEVWASDLVLKCYAPLPEELDRMRPGLVLACMLAPARSPELLDALAVRGVTALALDAVPRISRAQSLDVLSSMANIAGYRAVVEAAYNFGSLLNGQVTAAGKVPPANVFVVGAGVAGLAAIGTANSMGAVVRAFDVRPEVAEQVESMGAEFVHLPDAQDAEASSDGYAREMSDDQERLVMRLYAEQSAGADIVITTALIPGRPAPRLITAEMVRSMRPGSVIVDMAAANGGNCELTRADQVVMSDNGVIILGHTDLAGRLPTQASQLFGTNLVNLVKLLAPGKDGQLVLDTDDVVQRSMLVTDAGAVTWPPPPVQVSAAPVPAAASATRSEAATTQTAEVAVRGRAARTVSLGVAAAALAVGLAFTPQVFLLHFTVFALAVVVGYYVISNVTHALHTPLMTETNAISGIILVGALLQIGSDNLAVRILSFIAVVVASINIFGGFLVANRMLTMFRKD